MKPTAFPINTLLNLFRQGTQLILILATGCWQAPGENNGPSTPAAAKPTVAILGVFHFRRQRWRPAFDPDADPLKRRQNRYRRTGSLAAFSRLRILVEFPKPAAPG